MKKALLIGLSFFLLLSPAGYTAERKKKDSKFKKAAANKFLMKNLKLFMKYDFYYRIELFRYYKLVKLLKKKGAKK